MVKPANVNDVLRKLAKPTVVNNRFSALSEGPLRTHNSRSTVNIPGLNVVQGRDHSNQSTRSGTSGINGNVRDRSYSLGKRKRNNSTSLDDEVEWLSEGNNKEVKMAELNSMIDATKGKINDISEIIKVSTMDPTIKSILEGLVDIQASIVANQQNLAGITQHPDQHPKVSIPPAGSQQNGAIPVTADTGARSKTTGLHRRHLNQAPLGDSTPWSEVVGRRQNNKQNSQQSQVRSAPMPSAVFNRVDEDGDSASDPVRRFRSAIKDSERSLLIHGLDMGKTPTINPQAMNSLATKALLKKASEVDPSADGTGIPGEEYAAVVQDVLSMATTVNFFGKRTKLAKKKNSEEFEDFYTVPVEYRFPDSGTRQAAEESLKKMCKVKTSVAYPANVRECIKQAYVYGKKKFKDSFIVVNVDAPGFRLVMKRRAGTERQWTRVKQGFQLPNECLDVTKKPGQQIQLIIEQVSSPVRRGSQTENSDQDRRTSTNGRTGSGNMDDDSIFHSPRDSNVSRGESLETSGLVASKLP